MVACALSVCAHCVHCVPEARTGTARGRAARGARCECCSAISGSRGTCGRTALAPAPTMSAASPTLARSTCQVRRPPDSAATCRCIGVPRACVRLARACAWLAHTHARARGGAPCVVVAAAQRMATFSGMGCARAALVGTACGLAGMSPTRCAGRRQVGAGCAHPPSQRLHAIWQEGRHSTRSLRRAQHLPNRPALPAVNFSLEGSTFHPKGRGPRAARRHRHHDTAARPGSPEHQQQSRHTANDTGSTAPSKPPRASSRQL